MLINANMNGPRWRETAILVTYDVYGGLYDRIAATPLVRPRSP